MMSSRDGFAWYQYGALEAIPARGIWKIEIAARGDYSFTLRRFPRESGLGFNDRFEGVPPSREVEDPMPESNNVGFSRAFLSIAGFADSAPIEQGTEEITFTMHLPPGKFDMEAHLTDKAGRVYPAYLVYIENLVL